jgi:hypothetical protein
LEESAGPEAGEKGKSCRGHRQRLRLVARGQPRLLHQPRELVFVQLREALLVIVVAKRGRSDKLRKTFFKKMVFLSGTDALIMKIFLQKIGQKMSF